jgi:hypothetical protein
MADGDMSRRVTGLYQSYTMVIRDGRPLHNQFSLEKTAFEFIDPDTAVTDFFDTDQLTSVYYPQIETLIKERTGATPMVTKDNPFIAERVVERATRPSRWRSTKTEKRRTN